MKRGSQSIPNTVTDEGITESACVTGVGGDIFERRMVGYISVVGAQDSDNSSKIPCTQSLYIWADVFKDNQ